LEAAGEIPLCGPPGRDEPERASQIRRDYRQAITANEEPKLPAGAETDCESSPKGECAERRRTRQFLVHVLALSARIRHLFAERLLNQHPDLHRRIDPAVWQEQWVTDCRPAGRGRCALRYLAAYVARSAFNEGRLSGYDERGRVLLRYKDSADAQWKNEPIHPQELIRRWLLHVLPKGFVAVRHFGFLSPAAVRALRRVRFLLGRGPVCKPVRPVFTMPCPCCQRPMILAGRIPVARGPPLSREVLLHAA
jgi:hypothetical protein